MQKNKLLQTEYIFLAIIFASVIWGIFAGFRVSRYQWIMIIGSVALFLGVCVVCDHYKKYIFMMITACIFFAVIFHTQLINGFRIINNKMALALNRSMDMGFYYYVAVHMEHSRRDSVLAVLFFLLVVGIILSFLRYKPLILFIFTGIMQCAVLAIAPYSISAVFFLFLASWIAYFSFRRGKKGFASIIYGICLCVMIPLYFHDQTTVPTDTMVKRNILVQIRKMTQGESYLAVGGLGNGDIESIGEVSPTGKKLFQVYAPEKDDLYLKSYVSGTYKDGKWQDEKKQTLVYGGETAIGLPYLFPDLRMDDFIKYKKGYIKTEKDIIFTEKRNLKIRYQKKQDSYLLFPYFCDTSQIIGEVSGDQMIKRNTGNKEYDMSYYQLNDLKKILWASEHLDFSKIKTMKNALIEKEYVTAMSDYGNYVKRQYLKVPKDMKQCLDTLNYKADKTKTVLKNVEAVSSYLKKNYEYTYHPGLALQGNDPIIYFLKKHKKGFCSHYASAAVFMLRNAGVPARYVEGYKIRQDQWKIGRAQVTDYEAHAWVEIYLDHIGWVPVDVTGRNTGKTTYENVEKEEKQNNVIVPNRKQFVTNVKKILHFIPWIVLLCLIVILTKMLQKKWAFKKMTNRQKILYYEKELKKYDKNIEKPSKTANRMTFEIIEKAKFSRQDITRQEVAIVKRHVELLKRKHINVTKILTKVK